jgi:hypothetical protein
MIPKSMSAIPIGDGNRFTNKIMRVKNMRLAAILLLLSTGVATAQTHHCAKDAAEKAMSLLKLHFDQAEKLENAGIDDQVRVLAPIKALKGNGKFDVLEVWGHIYKADYRMRFIYAQGKGCTLMGQEILEASNPY